MVIILPVGVDYRTRRYPVVTFTLMGICTLVYVVTLMCKWSGDAESVQQWVFDHLWLKPAESHWWTFLTHQFVHEGFFHLLGNMIFLFLFGSCVEDIIGRLHFTIFYLLSGIGASLAYILFAPEHFASAIPMGGASGAISGCIGGFLLLLLKTKIEFKWVVGLFFIRFWSGGFFLSAWLVISFWFAKDLLSMILGMAVHHRGGGVAFGAHVGGTLIGTGLIALEKIRLKHYPLVIEEETEEEIVAAARPVHHPPVQAPVRVKYSLKGAVPIEVEAVTTAPAVVGTIHLFWQETQHGPFTPEQIQQKFITNEIPADGLYWQEGMEDWRTVEELRTPGTA